MSEHIHGRGAQYNSVNRFSRLQPAMDFPEGIDEAPSGPGKTEVYLENPKKILNSIDSPDIGSARSLNPYQGCEHGCIYCYARNSHEYWGWSAGIDFEQKIIVKPNAPELLRKEFKRKNYVVQPVMLSGNTDCYQPLERKYKITRSLLEVFLEHRHPVSIITKNSLILRDTDILTRLSNENLVRVTVSLTTLDETLRQKLEPRTASAKKRLEIVRTLSEAGISVGILIGPVIPGLNNQEIPAILKAASENGATSAGYIMVRLNGQIGALFTDWVHKHFPDRADKVLNHIRQVHGGQLNDSRFGLRMKGEGILAESIASLFRLHHKKYFSDRKSMPLDTHRFIPDPQNRQLSLF